jgi:hypothetical protein
MSVAAAPAAAPTAAVVPVATQPATLEQKCRAVLEKWQPRFDVERMNVLVSPPFIIAGDANLQRLARYRDGTVLAAARALSATFFDVPPDKPIVILLFESAEPYRRLSKKWLGDDDDVSPYGYFRSRDNVMVMNVGTGTGTLVHELTHALIKPDFPKVPDWFNEGLGSLYEQCTLANNSIRGLENWRLPALQKAIREKKVRTLQELINDPDFYGDQHVGLNYAEARYLLMYLQDKGKLPDFYKRLRANHDDDPTGEATLRNLLAPQSLEAFEKEWRAWVLTLRFPPPAAGPSA